MMSAEDVAVAWLAWVCGIVTGAMITWAVMKRIYQRDESV